MSKKDPIQSGILGDISPADTAKNDRSAFNPGAGGREEPKRRYKPRLLQVQE